MKRQITLTLLPIGLVIFCLTFGHITLAAPGDLDPTFSRDGKLTNGAGRARGVAIQPDGKMLVAGDNYITPPGWYSDFVIARYNTDGSLDASFGGGGRVITPIGTYSSAYSLAIQSDGKIVAAGFSINSSNNADFAIARYNTDGSLDTSFDGDGKVTSSVRTFTQNFALSVAIDSNGKIVAAGYSNGSNAVFALVRYNTDGQLDTSFDGDGKVTTLVGTSADALSVVIQSDMKIVAAGESNGRFALVRYDTNGSLDPTFGGTGVVLASTGKYFGQADSVAIQSNGKIVAAGSRCDYANEEGCVSGTQELVRVNTDGSLDTSFDSDGKVVTPIGSSDDFANSVAVQSNGKIVAAGSGNGDFALVRYNENGSLDSTFGGGDGISLVDFANGSNDRAYGMALDGQGRAVVVGESNGAFAIARFLLGDGPSPTPTITVTNTNDSGAGSLRQAIADATPSSTINFDASVFATPQTITLTMGQLVINTNLTLQGPGASLLSISGNYASTVFFINNGVTATLDGITIKNGGANGGAAGGGINNGGTLTVTNSTISNNGAYYGGGIYNGGTLTFSNSTISGNSSSFSGGGIENGGILSVSNSIISGNHASTFPAGSSGGGIYNRGSLTVSNSNISGNTSAHGSGGGLANEGGNATINNSTVSGNDATWGGGVHNQPECNDFDTCPSNTAYVYITNSTIASNTGGGIVSWGDVGFLYSVETLVNTIVADGISGTIDSASHNLIGDAASSGGIVNGANGNIAGVDPMLGPLRDNGGPTPTHALLAGSPAINAGDNALAIGGTDQRGPGFPRIGGGTVDIGAFELLPPVSVSGRLTRPDGLGVGKATVWITDPLGVQRTAITNPFGFYSFDNVAAGGTFTMGASSKLYRFPERQVQVDAALTGVDFVAIELFHERGIGAKFITPHGSRFGFTRIQLKTSKRTAELNR
jgi:uncharacterized delta-60 repeat protein